MLIGVPGMERRLARYRQFYSSIGFMYSFGSLGVAVGCHLIAGGWNSSARPFSRLIDPAARSPSVTRRPCDLRAGMEL